MNWTPYQYGEMLAGFLNAARPAPASADHGVTNMLNQILKETRIMSDAQTQQGRDVAQIVADLAVIKPAFQTMVDKIAALNAAAAANAGTVSPELQEQIDGLHAFAQSVAPTPVLVTPSEPVADPASVVPVADLVVSEPAPTAVEPAPAATEPAPSEPTIATPLADTTATPAPIDPAPAAPDTSAPTGTETPLPTT